MAFRLLEIHLNFLVLFEIVSLGGRVIIWDNLALDHAI
jgi:hypothetical protein